MSRLRSQNPGCKGVFGTSGVQFPCILSPLVQWAVGDARAEAGSCCFSSLSAKAGGGVGSFLGFSVPFRPLSVDGVGM